MATTLHSQSAALKLGNEETPLLPTVMEQISAITGVESSAVVIQESNSNPWHSKDNRANPLHWSAQRKYSIIALVSSIELLTHMTSLLYAPALTSVQRDLGDPDPSLAVLSMTIYTLGLNAAPLLFAPLSEVYGRLAIYRASLAVFLLFTIACAIAPSLPLLVVFRLLAGSSGAAPVAIGGAMVYDLFEVEERGWAMAVYNAGPIVGSLLGPPLGGVVVQVGSWRVVFWVIGVAATSALVATFALLRETHGPTTARRYFANRRSSCPADQPAIDSLINRPSPTPTLSSALFRPLRLLTSHPAIILLSLLSALISGTMNTVFSTLATVFQTHYDFSTSESGLPYLGVTVGFLIGTLLFGRSSDRVAAHLASGRGGVQHAEYRLPAMGLGLPFVALGMLGYGWSVSEGASWAVPVLGLNLFGIGLSLIRLSLQTYLVDAFTDVSASATAAVTVVRAVGGSFLPVLGPVLGPVLYWKIGLGEGNSVVAAVDLALCVVPVALWVRGRRWREKHAVQWT